MEQREEKVRLWFDMWLRGRDLGISRIFAPNAVYVESWGPKYEGIEKIAHWFQEWNTRGRVLAWDIRQFLHAGGQTVVEWHFHDRMDVGREECFDGMSLIQWDGDGRIASLREFGCNCRNYDPYQAGPSPRFREEAALWF